MNVQPRLNRLFGKSGNCFDVAIDHGAFNEPGFLEGIEDLSTAVQVIAHANPDAIQLTAGQAELLQQLPGKSKPALVLRTDIANIYGKQLPSQLFSRMIEDPIGQALRLDAACVVVNLLLLPNQPDLHRQCIDNITRLKPDCERFGMPLMIEPLVMQDNQKAGGYMVDGDLKKILALVRQATELGADLIKADPCDDASQYHQVVRMARKPVLVRGGSKASEKEIFERTFELMKQGARGIVYGRNVIQHANPAAMTRALMAIVHDKADASAAMKIMQTNQAA
jgi:DhnA family fructose-bisphosphate aldolase class Ia